MIHAILQARMSSTRLPGKALLPLAGAPALLRQTERIRQAQMIDSLTVATSTDPSDDTLEALCRANGVTCYRGSLTDVLDRFYRAARAQPADHIARFTGDCPLIDPDVVDATARFYLKGGLDYASNNLEPTFPDGLDVEFCKIAALEAAWKEAALPSEREHVTPFLYHHRERFNVGCYKNATDLSALRWTLDEKADYDVIKAIFEALYPQQPHFRMTDVLAFLDRYPEYKTMNHHHQRNEGYQRSLQADRAFLEKKGPANV